MITRVLGIFLLSLFAALHVYGQDPDMLRANPDAIAEIEAGYDTASVAWWFNEEDATDAMQAAIDSRHQH